MHFLHLICTDSCTPTVSINIGPTSIAKYLRRVYLHLMNGSTTEFFLHLLQIVGPASTHYDPCYNHGGVVEKAISEAEMIFAVPSQHFLLIFGVIGWIGIGAQVVIYFIVVIHSALSLCCALFLIDTVSSSMPLATPDCLLRTQ